MEFNNKKHLDDWEDRSDKTSDKPNAWRVNDDENLKEDNLARNLYGKSEKNMKPVKEGQAMGGHSFGKNSNTPAGDDKNNPSQNAGYTNPYFARTEPLEEHTEAVNFKPKGQDGEPAYSSAQPYANWNSTDPKSDPVERGNGENDRPNKGTDGDQQENKDEPNIPGPNELPDQQKVGEDVGTDEIRHIET